MKILLDKVLLTLPSFRTPAAWPWCPTSWWQCWPCWRPCWWWRCRPHWRQCPHTLHATTKSCLIYHFRNIVRIFYVLTVLASVQATDGGGELCCWGLKNEINEFINFKLFVELSQNQSSSCSTTCRLSIKIKIHFALNHHLTVTENVSRQSPSFSTLVAPGPAVLKVSKSRQRRHTSRREFSGI